MMDARRTWLVVNGASGSNDDDAVTDLIGECRRAGLAVERVVSFPEQALPDAAALDGASVDMLAVFAGDGTVNAVVAGLAGWRGAVLVLPGGTMNLLYHRLHGVREIADVLRLAGAGKARLARPKIVAGGDRTALADCLAGPGACWFEVREAMREADVLDIAGSAASAVGETLGAPGIACREPPLGKAEGYPLVMLTPTAAGIRVSGFHAETPAEFLQGSWALLRRRFREGPHDHLGTVRQLTLASTDGERFGVLLDGEKSESPGETVFRLAPCAVDLLATQADGR